MILDWNWDKNNGKFVVSYITSSGSKRIREYRMKSMRTYIKNPMGEELNWDGCRCSPSWTQTPSTFDMMNFIATLNDDERALLLAKNTPALYAWDIETEILPDVSPDEVARTGCAPVTTISLCSPGMNTVVLGWRALSDDEINDIKRRFDEYLSNVEFYRTSCANGSSRPQFQYIMFKNEHDMLKYFIKNIVAKTPVLAGWNSASFDEQCIYNRIKNYYQDIDYRQSSIIEQLKSKLIKNKYDESRDTRIMSPLHTYFVDLQWIVDFFDHTVIKQKESLSLDWIAHESLGVNKIKYKGNLDNLYNDDYATYVFYNAIDSVLVQLINKRFRTMNLLYNYANYCNIPLNTVHGQIATSEALVFKDFFARGIRVVNEHREPTPDRILGAYVRKPRAGLYSWVTCNDFASLYPSSIATCNLSFENYVGHFWRDDELDTYKRDIKSYIVSGPNVFKNDGTAEKPVYGEPVTQCVDWDALKPYLEDEKYFVSSNGVVYRNDKDYAFRRIQLQLRADRNVPKYLGKKLNAQFLNAIEHEIERREKQSSND